MCKLRCNVQDVSDRVRSVHWRCYICSRDRDPPLYEHIECKLVQSAYFEGRDLPEKEAPPLRLEVHPVSSSDRSLWISESECLERYRLELHIADHSLPYRISKLMIHTHAFGSAPAVERAAGRFVDPLDAQRVITCQRTNDTIISSERIMPGLNESIHLGWEAPCGDISVVFYYYVYDVSGVVKGPFTWKAKTSNIVKRDAMCEEGAVRLVDGPSTFEGRAEICQNGVWGTICSLYSTSGRTGRLARVVCRQLGYPASGALHRWANTYGSYPNVPVAVAVRYCDGRENNLAGCTLIADAIFEYCDHSNDIGVLCQDACQDGTRLVGGSIPSEGQLEVCMDKNWGTVCGLLWGGEETSVACRGLGYNGGGQFLTTYFFAYNNEEVFRFYCTGSESSLMECVNTTVTGSCSDRVKLSCVDVHSTGCQEGDVRLQEGRSLAEGTVEICLNSTWQTLCSTYVSMHEASVICYQLGFSKKNARRYSAISSRGSGPVSTTAFQCNGTETTLMECSIYMHGDVYCSFNRDAQAAVMCEQVCPWELCENGAIQLRDGNSQYEGALELCHRNIWTQICRPGVVDEGAAQVVCKQLGFSSSGAVIFEDSSVGAEMAVFEIHCNGYESSLTHCETVHSQYSSCLATNLGIRCQGGACMNSEIRLVGGQSELEGTVEICRNEEWGSICDDNWGYSEARVVCRQLGYSPLGARWYYNGYFGRTSAPIHLSQVQCTGSELSLLDCEYNEQDHSGCYDSEDVGVQCQLATGTAECINGDIRLIGGQSESEGTVEICFNNTWGSICHYHWSYPDAEVVCRQLGFSPFGVRHYSNGHFGQSEGPVFLTDVQCSGQEYSLIECAYTLAYEHPYCYHTSDAGVKCYLLNSTCEEGNIQLVGGVTVMVGTVAVCYNGTWRRVCANTQWDSLNAAVVCRQLGFSPFGALWASEWYYQSDAGQAASTIEYIDNVNCTGSESSILSCSYTPITSCNVRRSIDVICQNLTNNTCENGAVRLLGVEPRIEGRVEVCVENEWTTICDQHWDREDAQVVCRQLGFSEGIPLSAAVFGEGEGSILYYHFDCIGTESLLINCPKQPISSPSQCTNTAVRCEVPHILCTDGEIRLVGGQSELEGTVEICLNQTWGTICDTNWGVTEAAVVCQQAGFYVQWAIPRISGYFGDSPAPHWLNNVQCSGNESLLLDCQHDGLGVANCHYGSDAGVRCLGPCTNGTVQLVNRESQQQGTVEICIDDLWHMYLVRDSLSPASSDETQEASVVCHQLGFSRIGAAVIHHGYYRYEPVLNPLHSSQVVLCNGTESSLNECKTPYRHDDPIVCPWDDHYDPHYYYEYRCHTNIIPLYQNYSIFQIFCNETDSSDNMLCETGEVQLTGGETEYEGRVEICIDNTWTRVCDPLWTDTNAKAVCRQLGYSAEGANAVFLDSYSGINRRPATSLHFVCTGIESSLLDCVTYASGSYFWWYDYYLLCYYWWYDDCSIYGELWEAGVLCQVLEDNYCNDGEVRLSHKQSTLKGIVQICFNNQWGYVCGDSEWGDEEATVVCKQLGYSTYGSHAYNPQYDWRWDGTILDLKTIWMMQPKCSGTEASLVECDDSQLDYHNYCYSDSDLGLVGVQCVARDAECEDGAVRLVGGRGPFEGRVEICFDRVWGMVCDDKWDSRDATVVCRQLGFPDVLSPDVDVYFGMRVEPILLDDLCCNGSESSLLQCGHAGVGIHSCTASNAAAVSCTHLVGPQNQTVIQREDADVQLSCSVYSSHLYHIQWTYRSPSGASVIIANDTLVSNSSKYSLNVHSESETLAIHDVTYADRGTYTCTARIDFDSLSSSAQLTVHVPPVVHISHSGEHRRLEFGNLSLQCTATAYPMPTVRWLKRSGTEFNILSSNRITTSNAEVEVDPTSNELPRLIATLTIVNLTTADSGEYVCEATNGIPVAPAIDNFAINVTAKNECALDGGHTPCHNGGICIDGFGDFYCQCTEEYMGHTCEEHIAVEVIPESSQPNITVSPLDISAQLIEPLNLTCKATGYPPPTYQWYRDGEPIPGAMLPYLYILEATPEDRGLYTCVATNREGQGTSDPGFVTIAGVYQYAVTVNLQMNASENATAKELVEELSLLPGMMLQGTNTTVYSVQALNDGIEEDRSSATILITVTHSVNKTKDGVPQDIRQELVSIQAYLQLSFAVTSITRYDGCPAQLEEPLIEGSAFAFNWTESEIGDVLHRPCPRECMDLVAESNREGEIQRRCGGTYTHGAHWEEVDLSQCGLSPIALQLCEATLLESTEKAEAVRNVTTDSDELGVPAVTVASNIISQLTTAAIEDEEVREDYLQSIDNLLQVNNSVAKESQRQSNSSSRLLQSLADFSDNVSLPNSSNAQTFTQKSYALRVADINTNSFAGETFSVNLGSVEEARNRSAVIDEDELQVTRGQEENTGATASVRVPMTTFSGTGEEEEVQRLTYTVFLKDTLFQSSDMNQENLTAGSIILAVRLNTTTTPDTANPLEASFQINELVENASDTICGQWDSQANGGLGAWATDSCTITSESDTEGTARYSRLGHFALLLDVTPRTGETVSVFALAVITYIGLVISLLCLIAFLITYLSSKVLRTSEHGQMLMNLSCSLIGLYIIFLIAGHVAPVPALCGIAAALLQYFMLVFFGWTAAEAIYLYMKLVKVMGTGANIHRYVLKSALIVWLVPLLIVTLSVGPGYKYYYKDDKSFCRAEEYPFWIGLIVPFGVIYIFNWVMFTFIMISICKHGRMKEKNKMAMIRRDITIAIGLATVFGLGWGFGLLATSSDIKELTFTFQIIFSLFVGSQGLLLLVLHGMRSSEARKEWKSWLFKVTSKSTKLCSVARSTATIASFTSSTYSMSTLTKRSTLPRESSVTKLRASTADEEKQVNDVEQVPSTPAVEAKPQQHKRGWVHGKHNVFTGSEPPPSHQQKVGLAAVQESPFKDKEDGSSNDAANSTDEARPAESQTCQPRRSFLPLFVAKRGDYNILKASKSAPPVRFDRRKQGTSQPAKTLPESRIAEKDPDKASPGAKGDEDTPTETLPTAETNNELEKNEQ